MSAISKSIRTRYLDFMRKSGMTLHEFSRKSGIPRSTLCSMRNKEDYDVRESNIRKIAQGMGVSPSVLFQDEDSEYCIEEIRIIENFRCLTERQKGRLEGYIEALVKENEDGYRAE